jgi:hypothetical protein
VLGGFDDRPELEAFVRERLTAISRAAIDADVPWGFDAAPLLQLARRVYERQPERVDADVVVAALTLECLNGCGRNPGSLDPPAFTTGTFTAEVQTSDVFTAGMRRAAIALAKYVPRAGSYKRLESYAALITAVAARREGADPELAAAVAAFIIAANPTGEVPWLTAAIAELAGPQSAGSVWARALASEAHTNPNTDLWDTIVEALRRSPTLADDILADAVVSHCARRSQSAAAVDEACVDLGLAWNERWAFRLEKVATADTPEGHAARSLLAAHDRERTRTWQSVLAEWRQAPAIKVESSQTLALWQYGRPSGRRRVRETVRLRAAGAAAVPDVAALYRTSGNPTVINDAAFVLSDESPQALSAAVIDRIERFRLGGSTAGNEDRDDGGAEGSNYFIEARRIAAGLLALEREGRATTRIHPLILALSIPDVSFSKRASGDLRATLDASQFADALFGFLAVRERYLVSEVNVYRHALTSYDGVGTAIERNLAGLLNEARGVPERVPWILKVIGISALGDVGGPSARALLAEYARDSGSYLEINTSIADPLARERAETKRFDKLAADALEHVKNRSL